MGHRLTEQTVITKTKADSLAEVKNLNLWGCDLEDVGVLRSVANVEILSLSVNRITTLQDIGCCSRLKELYLRKNEISDLGELLHLTKLKDLQVLWLSENPCSERKLYRSLAIRILPNLMKLDSQEVSQSERVQACKDPEVDRFLAIHPLALGGGQQPPASARVPLLPSDEPSGGGNLPRQESNNRRQPAGAAAAAPRGGGGAGGAGGQKKKNIFYAVMALISELDLDDLVYVKREIEQRLGSEAPII